MDLKDIKAIIDLMKKNAISEFELERQDFKIRLKRGGVPMTQAEDLALPALTPGTVAVSTAGLTPVTAPPVPPIEEIEIKAPMIGTFYRSPSPEAMPYVEIGTEVTPETVVCIIEAMKVMNEIKAETKGVITQALVENSKPVEFGQAMFKIRPT